MTARSIDANARRKSSDFWKFWLGQLISSFGSSFTTFALPLLIFKLTGSAISLGLGVGASLLPYLLFGFILGAWADRVDRKRLMIQADLLRAFVIALLPLLAWMHVLSIWWIYLVAFISSTLSICFDAAGFAAIPSLVNQKDLMTANGRVQASYSFTQVIGPLLAALLVIASLPILFLFDALSFLASAGSLVLVQVSFNRDPAPEKATTSIYQDIIEGLRFLLTHPVLRWLTLILALINLATPAIYSQLVLFAKQSLAASDAQIAILYAAGSAGVVCISLIAGLLNKRFSYSTLALGALLLYGLLIITLALTRWYWAALPLWALASGVLILFNIANVSLGQAIIPDHLLGRIASFVKVLTWSLSPLGALLGGIAIVGTGNVLLVYAGLGAFLCITAVAFAFTPLGHTKNYLVHKQLPQEQPEQELSSYKTGMT